MALIPLEPLNRVRRMNPAAVERYMKHHGLKVVHIYSAEHGAYWRRGNAGYTQDTGEAALYRLAVAFDITCHCGPEKRIYYQLLKD